MSRVLVTGGAGFIGSHLCDRLLRDGHDVVAIDNLFTGDRSNLDPRVELIEQDVTEPFDVEVNAIYNLASPASPVAYQETPVETVRTNVLGAIHALELAKRRGCPVLQASTSEVYGDPDVHPQPESYFGRVNPIGPRACYDEGKRCAETLFFDYHREFGLTIKVARIFNTYGPRMQQDDGRVLTNFVYRALAGEALTVHGDGAQTRSFCYVDDLVDGLVRLMNTPPNVTGPVNLGNPEEIGIGTLARIVCELVGNEAGVEHAPALPDDPRRRRPDIFLARQLLGWKPTTTLRVGLRRMIDAAR